MKKLLVYTALLSLVSVVPAKAEKFNAAYHFFCKKHTCAEEIKPIAKTAGIVKLLNETNTVWNARITYVSDKGEKWRIATTQGDCEDYALAKQEALVKRGVPRTAMRMAVGRVRGQGHAVLIVFVGNTHYVLDNLTNSVYRNAGKFTPVTHVLPKGD